MRSDQDLTLKVAALARSAPTQWDEFLTAFRRYDNVVKDQCVQAAPATLPTAQGRAQQCASLLGLFEGAVKAADRITR